MRKINSKIVTKFISEAGGALQNKDYFAYVELDKFAIYAIADSIDNDQDLCSAKITITKLIAEFTENPSLRKNRLKKLIKAIHKELIQESRNFRFKSSITIVVTNYVKMRYVQVGNTRFYLFREDYLKHRTKDQSLTQELVEKEEVSLDKLAQHEERNNLYNYLGQDKYIRPYISKKIKLREGDILALLTKGIWENIDLGEFRDAIIDTKDAQQVIDNIEEMLLSKQPKDLGNYTLAVSFIDKTYKNPKKAKAIKRAIMIIIPFVIVCAVVGGMVYRKHKKKQEARTNMEFALISGLAYVEDENFIRANEEFQEALKLAKQLKEENDIELYDKYVKLIALVIEADKSLQQEEYYDAIEKYDVAKEKAYYADQLGHEYIEEQWEEANKHIEVIDLLEAGNKKLALENEMGALESYKQAKSIATGLFYKEGKKEAIEKINQIEKEKAEREKQNAQQQKEEETKKEEEQTVEEETMKKNLELKKEALELELQGDSNLKVGTYEEASMYYDMAIEMYKELELFDYVSRASEKKVSALALITKQKTNAYKAELYIEDANQKIVEHKVEEAKLLYLIAKDIYLADENQNKVKLLEEKIALAEAMTKEKQPNN